MKKIAGACLLLVIGACGPPEPAADADTTWVGTITTEGNLTTVVNESGSVWGGTATLVEEASIGVEAGATEYMFGSVREAFATDSHIYVVDGQIPQLRYYGLDGKYVGNIGRPGQGPGEYLEPVMVTGDNAGRIYLYDTRAGIRVFSEDGEALGDWSGGLGPGRMVATGTGTLWARAAVRDPRTGRRTYGVGEYGPVGLIGDVRFPTGVQLEAIQTTVTLLTGGSMPIRVPFSPRSGFTIAPSGGIVAWASDRYRFEIQSESGAVIVVEKRWTPVPIAPEEADWHRRLFTSRLRREPIPTEWIWDGAEMPSSKPAFTFINVAASGEIWVVRPGSGERLPDCVEDPLESAYQEAVSAPCWRDRVTFDVFDIEGRYLGEVEPPADLGTNFRVRNDQVVGVVQDEAGTIMVKRYRLVLPGEEER